jgi:hypothetical protein
MGTLEPPPQHLQIVINLLSLSALPEWILSHLVWFKCVERTGSLGDGVKKGKLTSRLGSDFMLVNNQLALCTMLRNCIKQFRETAQDHGGRLCFHFRGRWR